MKLTNLLEQQEYTLAMAIAKHGIAHFLPNNKTGDFDCDQMDLTSLAGAPEKINQHFHCSNNKLTSLAEAPLEIAGDFICTNNRALTELGIKKPIKIGADFWLYRCGLTSLKGIHRQVKQILGVASFEANPIRSHMLGLLKIEGLQEIKFDLENHGGAKTKGDTVTAIINRHLENGRDVIACQDELIDAGYEEYAQL
jgi:hypothetical protein